MRKNEETKAIAMEALKNQIDYIKHLKSMHPQHQKFLKWYLDTINCIKNIYGDDSDQLKAFKNISFDVGDYFIGLSRSQKRDFGITLDTARVLLISFKDEIDKFWIYDSQDSLSAPRYDNKNVFIIHGHNESIKKKVSSFIRSLGLNPIILHEKPNQGKTIIEKFEKHSNVTYAVAIFSPDDVGRKKEGLVKDKLKNRARQNVVFEFGYFIGKIGRDRVCCLYKKGVELPSDYSGVLYIAYDKEGSWKEQLIKEFSELNII